MVKQPMSKRLFIAVATRQNVANLPPILEYGEPGDYVVWLESEEAQRHKWAESSRSLLTLFGLQSPTRMNNLLVKDANCPCEVAAALEKLAVQCRAEKLRPVLVCNGGKKLTPLGLVKAFQDLSPVLLYSDDMPAALQCYEDLHATPRILPYRKCLLGLKEILKLNGYTLHEPPVLLWSVRNGETVQRTAPVQRPAARAESAPPPVEVPDFSQVRAVLTCERIAGWLRTVAMFYDCKNLNEQVWKNLWHATGNLVQDYYATTCEQAAAAFCDLSYDKAHSLCSAAFDKWRNQMEKLKSEYAGPKSAWRSCYSEQTAAAVFQATVELIVSALGCVAAGTSKSGLELSNGYQFEIAVGERVARWMAQHQGADCVAEVWRNVKAARIEQPETVVIECDVLVVLRNAILLHIECKLGTVERKDIDARIFNLQKTGSRLARMAICAPLYTCRYLPDDPAFVEQHRLRMRVQEIFGIDFLPYTDPDQPRQYQVAVSPDILETHICPSFEEALATFLRPYVPSECLN
ncbi:MAG: hypothetical protein C4297_12165 [Gemmataceae bacterium]